MLRCFSAHHACNKWLFLDTISIMAAQTNLWKTGTPATSPGLTISLHNVCALIKAPEKQLEQFNVLGSEEETLTCYNIPPIFLLSP